jgi:cell division protein FtsB
MFDFHQKRKLRNFVNSPYTQGVILVIALGVGWSAFVRYEIAMDMAERRVAAEQAAEALEAKKQALEEKVEYLSGERGIEAEMRRQFDVALEGEQVVVIVEEEVEEDQIMPLSTTTKEEEKKWYQFWR